MRKIFTSYPWLGSRALLFAVLAILPMMLDYRAPAFKRVDSFLSMLAAPLRYAVAWPVQLVGKVADNFSSQQALLEDNTRLQVENTMLSAQVQKLMVLQKENDQLRNLTTTVAKNKKQKILVARILAVDAAPYIHEVILDRGSDEGIYVGQPVLTATGVMGQIVAVSPLVSRLMLLSDSRSAVPVEIERNGLRSIAVGNGDASHLYLSYVPATSDVQVGDKLLTSGLGLVYPSGYPLGTVSNIIHDAGDSFLKIEITPAANLEQSRLVILLWPQQEALAKIVKKELVEEKVEQTQMRQVAEGAVDES